MDRITKYAALTILAVSLSGCVASRKIVPGVTPAATSAVGSAAGSGIGSPVDFGPYRIGADDVLAVRVFREPDLSYESVRIDAEGRFEMPLIGRVEAAGKTPDELSDEITRRYGSNYLVNPQVSVNLLEANSKRITVEGAVVRPGLFTQATPTDLLSAVAVAGGPIEAAKLNEVAVFRKVNGQNMVAAFDLSRIRSGEMENPVILPGDTVVLGYSRLRSGLQDFLRAAPLISLFRIF